MHIIWGLGEFTLSFPEPHPRRHHGARWLTECYNADMVMQVKPELFTRTLSFLTRGGGDLAKPLSKASTERGQQP